MQFQTILTLIALVSAAATVWSRDARVNTAPAPHNVFQDMREAYAKGDSAKLSRLLPMAQGQVLEPWAAYWELKARLETAEASEVQAFLKRYAGTYQEDRLRNDWLLLVGKRQDWSAFAEQASQFRMQDDRQIRCYTLAMESQLAAVNSATEVKQLWTQQRNDDEGCALAAQLHLERGQLKAQDIWLKAYLATEAYQFGAAKQAIALVDGKVSKQAAQVLKNPESFLLKEKPAPQPRMQHLATLALIRWAHSKPDSAARQLSTRWSKVLRPEQRELAWAAIGKQAAFNLSNEALGYFQHVKPERMGGEHLIWRTRAALHQGHWREVIASIDAMPEAMRQDGAWIYWRARANMTLARNDLEREQARQALKTLAGSGDFYDMLALEALGDTVSRPPAPPPPTAAEMQTAQSNAGLVRALAAFDIGLRSEAVREWNYTTNMHEPGGMSDRELLAAAQLACNNHIWDRCINTSERTKSFVDIDQRFPMPHAQAVLSHSRSIGLDPAYVYGLIRQESRFITDARSGVGASGLMQVMPKTAIWTAKKIGLQGFKPSQLHDRDTNIAIGTGYLKLVLDSFDGSLPLAAAAYNAGPSRSRNWRASAQPSTLDTAIWIETIPFAETRNYVKKVLANTTMYAAIISSQNQSLLARLGELRVQSQGSDLASRDIP
jgi:soluble lytic murein transglycosylase